MENTIFEIKDFVSEQGEEVNALAILESALKDYYECISPYDDPFFNGWIQGVAFHAYYVVKADTLALVREEYTDEGEWISTLETPLKENAICQAFDYCTEHGYVVVSYKGETYQFGDSMECEADLPIHNLSPIPSALGVGVLNLFECALEYYEKRERVQERALDEIKSVEGAYWYVYEPNGIGRGKDLKLLHVRDGVAIENSYLRNVAFEDAYEEYCRTGKVKVSLAHIGVTKVYDREEYRKNGCWNS